MRQSRIAVLTKANALVLALVIPALMPDPTRAVDLPPFESDWNAASGLLPDQASPAWTLVDNAEPEQPSIANDLLSADRRFKRRFRAGRRSWESSCVSWWIRASRTS
jgi:hypothetical protein